MRKAPWLRVAGVGLTLLFSAAVVAPGGTLKIHIMDVRHGASLLVVGPGAGGKTVLMDAGNRYRGGDVVAYLRDELKIEAPAAIDYTLMSHMHSDHIGGFDEIFGDSPDRYQVAEANLYNGGPDPGSAQFTEYMAAATATTAGAPVAVSVEDPVLQLGDGAYLKILAANGKLVDGSEYSCSHPNERSVSALIRYGGFEFIWSGDLEGFDIVSNDSACTGRSPSSSHEDLETPLADALIAGPTPILDSTVGVDVLHVNHHGSDTSTNSHWMNTLRPEVAVISVGENAYEHPKISVVENVLGAQATDCVTVPEALVLQTREGDTDPGTDASYAGHVVGHIEITTDGIGFDIDGKGAAETPDERGKAALPGTWLIDDLSPACAMVINLGAQTIDSPETWRAKHLIETTGAFTVEAGGEVLLHAGTRVALGDGFSVGAMGEVTIETVSGTDCSEPAI